MQTVDEAIPIMMEEPKIAFFTFDTDLVHDIRFLTLDLNDALLDYSGFGFPKDSEFTDIFNFHLKSLEEQGKF